MNSVATLTQALSISPGDVVAVVGAGGKTTLCWRLVQEIKARGERVIFTTTTKIWQPAAGVFDVVQVRPLPYPLLDEKGDWRTACAAASVDGPVNQSPINGAGMPTVQTKLNGFTTDALCAFASVVNRQSSIVIEADGARGLRIKAPGANEPQIPTCVDVVCVLANLDAIGRPLDERIAHRVDRVAQLTRTMPGSVITAPIIIELITHSDGGLRAIPPQARKVAVLTQQSDAALHPDASQIMGALCVRGYDRAMTISPRAPIPILVAQ
jgi:probable selenium-dependent hydroxylase accessory protein YqeC